MDKKVLIQITLLITIVLIITAIFSFYQTKKSKNLAIKKEDNKGIVYEDEDAELNIIKDITYLAKDDEENIFNLS